MVEAKSPRSDLGKIMIRNYILYSKDYIKWYFLVLTALVFVVLCFVVIREDRSGIMTVVFLDVGQGDSIFIESPTGVQVIVDGGPAKNLMREISEVLPFYDRSVDLIVVTNPDKDHYEGFIGFLEKYSVDVVLEPGTSNVSGIYKTLEDEIKNKNIPKIIALRGQIIDLGGGAFLEVLFPDRDISGLGANDGSLVMRLVYGETSVMFQGDSTVKIEDYLVSLGGNLDSDILKTGHHGSKTSTGENYIEAVSPEWAVISAGQGNSYGHPHKETLETLNKEKVKILGTYELGRIVFKSDGKQFVFQK